MDLFKLLGTIVIDNDTANQALDETQSKAKSTAESVGDMAKSGTKSSSKFTKGLTAVGKGALTVGKWTAAGLAVGTTAMAGLTTKAITAAGELEQNIGGSEAVFGKHAGKMQTTAKTAFSSMGLSTSDFLATANKMGALFQGAGFGIEESANLSAQAMQRAADVASIMGIDTSSAMEAISGAAKGNFEMMDNLGVAMNETSLNAYAASKGINKTTQEMTQQEKIGLAMEMFLDKTSYAAGNYAKENETLAGSLGTARAALSNFLSGSGTVEQLVGALSGAATVIVNNINEMFPALMEGVTQLIAQIVPMIPGLLNTLLPSLISGATSLINGLVAAMPAIISALMAALPAIIEGVTSIVNALIESLPAMVEAIVGALPTLLPLLINGLVSMIVTLCTNFATIIQPIIDALPDIIVSVVNALVANLPALIAGVVQLVAGLVMALPAICEAIATALSTLITGWITSIGEWLAPITGKMSEAWENAKTAMSEKWESIKTTASEKWESIKNEISNKVESAKSTISQKWESMKATASSKWTNLNTTASDKWESIKTTMTDKITSAKDTLSGLWATVSKTMGTEWGNMSTAASSAWESIKSAIQSPIESARDLVETAINKIKGFFDFDITWPNIPLPHFSITPAGWGVGDLFEGVIPSLGIEWYAKAMNNPMVLDEPSVFGYDAKNNNLLAGGENGAEVVAGANTLMGMISRAVAENANANNERVVAVLSAILHALTGGNQEIVNAIMSGHTIVLNNREFARAVKQYA